MKTKRYPIFRKILVVILGWKRRMDVESDAMRALLPGGMPVGKPYKRQKEVRRVKVKNFTEVYNLFIRTGDVAGATVTNKAGYLLYSMEDCKGSVRLELSTKPQRYPVHTIATLKIIPGNGNILYPKWEKGHYKGGMGEYERLEQARGIHREAADASASWGMFQIMGFNYAACDEPDVNTFIKHMAAGERMQLVLSARFIRKAGMLPLPQNKNRTEFAKRYNGAAFAQNGYDFKPASVCLKLKAGL